MTRLRRVVVRRDGTSDYDVHGQAGRSAQAIGPSRPLGGAAAAAHGGSRDAELSWQKGLGGNAPSGTGAAGAAEAGRAVHA